MSGKMKGFFKYITQIFSAEEKEDDVFEIGAPTDVKHVAHIGMDGPSANTPSWMGDFKSSEADSPKPANVNSETPGKPSKDSKPAKSKAPKSRHGSIDNGNSDSLERKGSDGAKPRRGHRTSDPTPESSGKARRTRNSNPAESPAREGSPAPTKPGRRRKNKNGSVDGSEKTDRSRRSSKGGDSLTDISLPDLDGSEHGPRLIEDQIED